MNKKQNQLLLLFFSLTFYTTHIFGQYFQPSTTDVAVFQNKGEVHAELLVASGAGTVVRIGMAPIPHFSINLKRQKTARKYGVWESSVGYFFQKKENYFLEAKVGYGTGWMDYFDEDSNDKNSNQPLRFYKFSSRKFFTQINFELGEAKKIGLSLRVARLHFYNIDTNMFASFPSDSFQATTTVFTFYHRRTIFQNLDFTLLIGRPFISKSSRAYALNDIFPLQFAVGFFYPFQIDKL